MLTALLALANFSLIYIMTQGGPGNATNILPLYSYQQAFSYNNLAYGALIGNVMVVIATVFGVLLRAHRGAADMSSDDVAILPRRVVAPSSTARSCRRRTARPSAARSCVARRPT